VFTGFIDGRDKESARVQDEEFSVHGAELVIS
jgi:hypothetical protein